eukprot:CAMPEP_0170615970 /NCGR_PEP_ID=MMETSP0224-20130122/25624_1 /TAXON_ID=285029 /ORGANISM="Togula jolla, Strain CCCM 725" /LENGTH=151 /DNA_ID=CAMNT_0010941743 /DNA_START=378 /DNA_END=833 /DNA_ORIENTATION=-
MTACKRSSSPRRLAGSLSARRYGCQAETGMSHLQLSWEQFWPHHSEETEHGGCTRPSPGTIACGSSSSWRKVAAQQAVHDAEPQQPPGNARRGRPMLEGGKTACSRRGSSLQRSAGKSHPRECGSAPVGSSLQHHLQGSWSPDRWAERHPA